jgi:hypothetical protein
MNAEGRNYLIASCSIGLGLVCGAGVLLFTTLAWASVAKEPQLPTVLFFVGIALLAFGCHRIDCLETKIRSRH